MRKKAGKAELSDPFALFKRAAGESFAFLVDEHGFEPAAVLESRPECAVVYRNATTGVIVNYEWGSTFWVNLVRREAGAADVPGGELSSLDLLIAERCPDLRVRQEGGFREHSGEYVREVLRGYARALRECAADILGGDFGVFPRLRERAAAEQRRIEAEVYGRPRDG